MSSINEEIIQEGKKLRYATLYDVYTPMNYAYIIKLIHIKSQNSKDFLLQTLYKKIQ